MHNNFIVSAGGIMSLPKVFGEKWEEFGEQSVAKYFEKGMKKFQSKLETFENLERPLTQVEEKELRFMLEALIEAKQILKK